SRAKAALSAGVMSSAGLPVHMQRSIHVPDHIVKRCVRLYTSGDVADARTVATDTAIRIEFNPTRPRERVRFSIAHEIAHTLFSDVAEQTRHRGGAATTTDEWQLEMLCNLAAAEFVMPIGSLPPTDQLPKIEQLMCERRKFDVSAEAFLIRVVKATTEPAFMFCASPIESQGSKLRYRVDYSIGSKSASAELAAGMIIPSDSIVYSCTAIGQTNCATEEWLTKRELSVECVGIPAFLGTTYPRVAGIVRFSVQDVEPKALNVVHGNVLSPLGTAPKIICQLVNDQARTWGGGVARSAAQKYPAAQQEFTRWIMSLPKRDRLGQVHFVSVGNNTYIASLVAQEGYGASNAPRIRYAPLERCFRTVAEFARDHGSAVNLPRIGAGQSGGSWDTVEEIIRDTLIAKGVRVTIYDLPPRRLNAGAELLI
ncbi:MAG: ImmA/IrrE family metallo-endopeptidase, partial [Methylocella sp.]